ncbi:MAG: hypothetical protein ACYDC1_05130, partial [Limisphaerales bacterium]
VTLYFPQPSSGANPWNIPETWIQQFGLQLTASSDADGDGFLDRFEYLAGSNPTNAASLLKMLSAARLTNGQGVGLTWSSVAGKRYTLRRFPTIPGASSSGVVVKSGIVAGGPVTSWTEPLPSQASGYFRVEVEP